MQQDMAGHECSRDASVTEERADKGRVLTYDEMKAAEAAFRGDPFNPAWSAAAAQVYTGISAAMANREVATLPSAGIESDCIRC